MIKKLFLINSLLYLFTSSLAFSVINDTYEEEIDFSALPTHISIEIIQRLDGGNLLNFSEVSKKNRHLAIDIINSKNNDLEQINSSNSTLPKEKRNIKLNNPLIKRVYCVNKYTIKTPPEARIKDVYQLNDRNFVIKYYKSDTIEIRNFINPNEHSVIASFSEGSELKRSIYQMNDGRLLIYYNMSMEMWAPNNDETEYSFVSTWNDSDIELDSSAELSGASFASPSLNNIKIRDLNKKQTDTSFFLLEGHTAKVNSVYELKDGRILSTSKDDSIKIWTRMKNSYECTNTIAGPSLGFKKITELEDGRLVTSCNNSALLLWDLRKTKEKACIANLRGHNLPVGTVRVLKYNRLISAGLISEFKVWDLYNPQKRDYPLLQGDFSKHPSYYSQNKPSQRSRIEILGSKFRHKPEASSTVCESEKG